MINKKKYLGINQEFPFSILDEVVFLYISGEEIEKEFVYKLLEEKIKGENRLSKAYSHIKLIFVKNEKILTRLQNELSPRDYLEIPLVERKALLLCLLSITFPVAFDLLNLLAKGFKVQSKINRNYIDQKMSSIYGSNRGIYNAVAALLPMFIDFDLIIRDRNGLYSAAASKAIFSEYISYLYIYTDIKLSGSKTILIEDLEYRPWYFYFEPAVENLTDSNLLELREMQKGSGYLGLSSSF